MKAVVQGPARRVRKELFKVGWPNISVSVQVSSSFPEGNIYYLNA